MGDTIGGEVGCDSVGGGLFAKIRETKLCAWRGRDESGMGGVESSRAGVRVALLWCWCSKVALVGGRDENGAREGG